MNHSHQVGVPRCEVGFNGFSSVMLLSEFSISLKLLVFFVCVQWVVEEKVGFLSKVLKIREKLFS